MHQDYVDRIPFARSLGIEVHVFEGGRSELHYTPRPEHLNSFGVAHGGACMTLLDVCLAAAARSVRQDMGVVTIEMKTSFMQPARGPLVGRGLLRHCTASMAFVEGTIYDAEERACAHATGTFKYVKRRPAAADAADDPMHGISTD